MGDAIELVVEAWNSVSADSIVACWRHAKCLPVQIFPVSLTCQDNIEIAEQDPVRFVRSVVLEQLVPSEGAGKHGESCILHDHQHASPEMLLEWVHLEESVVIHIAEFMDEDGNEEEDEAELDQLERISAWKDKVLSLLHSIHKLGVELDHVQISDVSKDLYVQVEKELSGLLLSCTNGVTSPIEN